MSTIVKIFSTIIIFILKQIFLNFICIILIIKICTNTYFIMDFENVCFLLLNLQSYHLNLLTENYINISTETKTYCN